MRAMTLERLVRDDRFASKVTTTAVGALGLDRPTEVVLANARENPEKTQPLLAEAHRQAVRSGVATVVHQVAVPFVGFEGVSSTDVKPDFVVVAPKTAAEGTGTWLIVGDVKDYERIRSRIEDTRLLKGFLQVAVGAESLAVWSRLPKGMDVHQCGVLAVPRNAFLQPEAVVENLADYRNEIAMRIAERRAEADQFVYDESIPIEDFVAHLQAAFDPVSCTSCTLFAYCRNELRQSPDDADLLVELGIPPESRPLVLGLVDGSGEIGAAPASVRATVMATLSGQGVPSGQGRIDPAGQVGTVNVVLAKSDAAALGVHGVAIQRISASGPSAWGYHVFDVPQSSDTRRELMKILGEQLSDAMGEMRRLSPDDAGPVHVVVPDRVTADMLASIADNLAGVELSRLRWKRDRESGRPLLTFDGEAAKLPTRLPEVPRTAVSFLLEEDRARGLALRSPVVDLRAVLARHVVAGGPSVASGRLDYLVEWLEPGPRIDHRDLGDRIEACLHTPGARLASATSDAIHTALTGSKRRNPNLREYAKLVRRELEYKTQVFDRAVAALEAVPVSTTRVAYRQIEARAQEVWRRRLKLHASDLVRFGRTYPHWRNLVVEALDADLACARKLLALSNSQQAADMAAAAGNRNVASAMVVESTPRIVLRLASRKIGPGSRIVLLHRNGAPCVDSDHVSINTTQKGAFKIDGMSIGPLEAVDGRGQDGDVHVIWKPKLAPELDVGDSMVVADFAWFSETQKGNRFLPVTRPKLDDQAAPSPRCTAESFDADPDAHQYCCKSHERTEAEFSDRIADRRSRGELNPQTWPPVRDADAFEVTAKDAPQADPFGEPSQAPPADLTIDELD